MPKKNEPEKVQNVVDNNPSLQNAANGLNNEYPNITQQLEDKSLDIDEIGVLAKYISTNETTPDFDKYLKENSAAMLTALQTLLDNPTTLLSKDDINNITTFIKKFNEISVNTLSINKSFKEQKINTIKNDMEQDDFYGNIINAYIDKIYKSELQDTGLISYIKSNFVITEDIQSAIKKYFDNGLDQKGNDNDFSLSRIDAFVDKDYSKIDTKKLNIRGFDDLELAYKNEKVKTDVYSLIDEEVGKFTRDDAEMQSAILESMKNDYVERINKMNLSEIDKNYDKIGENSSFKKEIKGELVEFIAENNRKVLTQMFNENVKTITFYNRETKANEKYTIQDSDRSHFETMINDTNSKNVNTMALVLLNYPDKANKIMEDLRSKVKTRGEYNSKSFYGVDITNAEPREQNNIGFYSTSLMEKQITESISETEFGNIQGYLEGLLDNADIHDIVIKVPEGKFQIQDQVINIISSIQNENKQYKIRIIETADIQNIKIDANEIKETPGKLHLELRNLPYNVIGNPEMIGDVLKNADPKMKELIENPECMITGGDIYSSASRQRTTYQAKPELEKYKDIANITNKTEDGTKVNQIDNDASGVTKNPSLAYNRGASLLDYFYQENKVADNASFDLTYGVNGKSKATLIQEENITNENDPEQKQRLEDRFKERQYAIIDLDFIKTENIPHSKEFNIDKNELMSSVEINIRGEVNTAGGGNGTRKPPKWMYELTTSKPKTKKPRIIKCPSFD